MNYYIPVTVKQVRLKDLTDNQIKHFEYWLAEARKRRTELRRKHQLFWVWFVQHLCRGSSVRTRIFGQLNERQLRTLAKEIQRQKETSKRNQTLLQTLLQAALHIEE